MSDDPKHPHDEIPPGDTTPDDESRWQRPPEADSVPEQSAGDEPPVPVTRVRRPRPRGDRFPMLPDEEPQTAPLKDPPRRPVPNNADAAQIAARDRVRNLIALFFLLASCGLIAYFAIIWQNPYSSLNPLAPPTPLPLVITATFTPSHTPTITPTFTPSATYTPTDVPTTAPTLTFTPIFLEGFSTPSGLSLSGTEEVADYRFTLQSGRTIYITNPAARGGCNWVSIAGSVTDFAGSPVNGYGVRVVGDGIDSTVATGSAPGFGPGGFELELGNAARSAQFVAQLLDPAGVPVSPVYTVETRADCDLNIAALRFVETGTGS